MLPHPPGSVVRLFARGGDERDGDFARSAGEIRRFAATHEGKNVYVAPNPTNSTGGVRHAAKDVTHWSFFVVDVDPIKEEHDIRRAREHVINALANRLQILGRPIVIDSGRGAQLWYRLPDVVLDDTVPQGTITEDNRVHRKTARRVNGWWLSELDEIVGMTNGCRIDSSVSDLPRVMRCPGTKNKKTGKTATFDHWTDRVYPDLHRRLLVEVPDGYFTEYEETDITPGQPWQMVFQHLTRMAQNYLQRGQEEPGRHRVMWHTAKKLRECGVTRKEAAKALKMANKLKGEDEELPPDQVKHALDTAYND